MVLGKLDKLKGIVVAIKANYLIVQLDSSDSSEQCKSSLLCTLRRSLTYHGAVFNVGDRVFLDSIDWKLNRAVIYDLETRETLFSRPAVANVTQIFVVLSIRKPAFNFEQASRFLLTAEKSGLQVTLILTKRDLISERIVNEYSSRLEEWGYRIFPISIDDSFAHPRRCRTGLTRRKSHASTTTKRWNSRGHSCLASVSSRSRAIHSVKKSTRITSGYRFWNLSICHII